MYLSHKPSYHTSQAFIHLGPLLHLGSKDVTRRTFITFEASTIRARAHIVWCCQSCHADAESIAGSTRIVNRHPWVFYLNAVFLLHYIVNSPYTCLRWPFNNTSNSCCDPVYKACLYYVNCNKPPPGKQRWTQKYYLSFTHWFHLIRS